MERIKETVLRAIAANPSLVRLGLFVCVAVLSLTTGAFAEDPFAQTYTTVGDWIEGNLGLLMALVIGGLGGMAKSFFEMGQDAFGTP